MKRIKEEEDRFFEYNVYFPKRYVYIGSNRYLEEESGIDFYITENTIKALLILDSLKQDTITIIYNSPGGDWSNGIAIYDVIKSLKSSTVFKGYGYVASLGSVLLQACNKRLLSKNSRLMIHDGYEEFSGIPKSLESWGQESKYARSEMYRIYYEALKKKFFKSTTKEQALKMIEEWCSKDTIFSSQTAVRMGFADGIINE